MRASSAILVAAAVGTLRLLQAERHSKRQLALKAAELHQAYCRDTAADQALSGEWADADVTAEQAAKYIHANRLLSFLSVKYRVGLLNDHTLRVQARSAMARDSIREYWGKFGSFREMEAKDRTDRKFNEIMSGEFHLIESRETAAA
ncbi:MULTISPECIES: DUF6082 family protein [Streptomyces]|uniref:Uncharacterized protein n=1 Tax=Streptomyces canarius TaxID=285453 RepID=A0ABQ3CF31_9ACTN|nr:DUF6082 family protein [Streptomyces canarius]GHA09315.1 hypothetical protein GCM10010345_12240 [Streptomyces canarius]